VGSNSSTRPNISGNQLRRLDYALSRTTQILQSIFLSYVIGGTITARRMIGLAMEGFGISRSICIQVLYDVLPLKEVPTGVTRVANNVRLSTSCSSIMYASPIMDLCIE
jgi:hypothetical protein